MPELRSIEICDSKICNIVAALGSFGTVRNLHSLKTLTLVIMGMKSSDEIHWRALDALFADSNEVLTALHIYVDVNEPNEELMKSMLPTISGKVTFRLVDGSEGAESSDEW
jgi:hypothetical protein